MEGMDGGMAKKMTMQIKQFEDKNLAQFSYAILSECEKKIVLIDPARDTEPYLLYAKENKAQIIGVIETHPHADFVSSHLELSQATGATLYTSREVHAFYLHQPFDEGDVIQFGKISLTPLNTPGHSPDSISIVLEHDGKQKAVFTGDTLFIGDCGRPDLREGTGTIQATRYDLAKKIYHSLREKLMKLPDNVLVYPAHGAGTLCGKSLSKESSSTIGQEKQTNWSLQKATEEEFIENLLADLPFVPLYFPYDVELNRKGAPALQESLAGIAVETLSGDAADRLEKAWIVDTRKEADFKQGHLPSAINLMENGKFETWLGSIIKPEEKFYLASEDEAQLKRMMKRAAAIGYEKSIIKALVIKEAGVKEEQLNLIDFKNNRDAYTILDVRNKPEVKQKKIFANSLSLPLPDVRDKIEEIPTDKPIVVHCAGGYRSAAAASLIQTQLAGKAKVFDLSEAIRDFS